MLADLANWQVFWAFFEFWTIHFEGPPGKCGHCTPPRPESPPASAPPKTNYLPIPIPTKGGYDVPAPSLPKNSYEPAPVKNAYEPPPVLPKSGGYDAPAPLKKGYEPAPVPPKNGYDTAQAPAKNGYESTTKTAVRYKAAYYPA